MRILYIDVDSLRPDHLGCYGYHRATSPNIDALARDGIRFDSVYVSDVPCLPSRTALWSGRHGFRTGVVGHGGTAADPFVEGPSRGHRDLFGTTGWMSALREAGLWTATVSSFGERHAAWHWYAGFNEIFNPGKGGMEIADEVSEPAIEWLRRNGRREHWFLHVNFWDPHTPYRTPADFGDPFEGDPPPAWLSADQLARLQVGFGPHSAREPHGWGRETTPAGSRLPAAIDSTQALKLWIDGYDTGVRYADEHIGRLCETLAELGLLDQTAIVVGADHGENQGELNVWGDHQTADEITCRVPLILRWPGLTSRVDRALHYHFDWAATAVELSGGQVPPDWDGRSFAAALRSGRDDGRPFVVLGQGAWSVQRSVRWGQWLCMRTYHDGYKQLEPVMLFDLERDPHEQHDLAAERPEPVRQAMALLTDWQAEQMQRSAHDADPLLTVLREGGPYYCRGELPAYLDRLRATGRQQQAARLEHRR